ncbi:MAG: hypothetical protein EBS53_02115 [Bacteroidetes bacterium]|nr:hypothetical protein [Bacteroidota bacterium]
MRSDNGCQVVMGMDETGLCQGDGSWLVCRSYIVFNETQVGTRDLREEGGVQLVMGANLVDFWWFRPCP